MSTTVVEAPLSSAQLETLVERFEAALGEAVKTGFVAPFNTHASALAEWVESIRGLSVECLSALEARIRKEADVGREAMLTALLEATSEYVVDAVAALDGAPEGATADQAEATISSLLEVFDRLPEGFPIAARAEQREARFKALPDDANRVRTLKALKRVVRPLRRSWTRTVPVAAAVRYELVHVEERAMLDAVRRPRVVALAGCTRLIMMTLTAIDDVMTLARGAEAGEVLELTAEVLLGAREALGEQAVVLTEDVRAEAERVIGGVEAAAHASRDSLTGALETLGTVERPVHRVGDGRRERARTRVRERYLTRLELWSEEEEAREDSLRAEAEVVRVACALRALVDDVAVTVRTAVGEQLRDPIRSLHAALKAAVRAAEARSASEHELPATLTEIEVQINEAFAASADLVESSESAWREVLEPIVALRDGIARLPRTVAESRQLLAAPVERASDGPGQIPIRTVPLRKFVAIHCVGRLGRDITGLIASAQPELETARVEIERLHQAAAFNVTAALGEADEEETEAAELVAGVLHRAVERLETVLEAVDRLEDSLSEGLRTRVDGLVAEMIAPVRARDAQSIRQAVLADGAKERLDSSIASGREATLAALGATRDALVRAGRRVAQTWRSARTRIGPAPAEPPTILDSLDEAVLDPRVAERLPLVYRQLFTLEALEWDGFLVGRDEELEQIMAAYRRWVEGQPGAVAVYGRVGSGKTTLLNAARRRLSAETPVMTVRIRGIERSPAGLLTALAAYFGAPGVRGFDDLAKRILRGPDRVVILEHGHYLMLRTVGGFEAVRALLGLIRATSQRVLWIMTMDRSAWRYLDHTIGMREHFAFEIDTTRLPAEQLEEAILTRHHVSGLALRFEPDERLRRSRRFRRSRSEEESQELAHRSFFEQLERVVEGNILLALFYWLRAIQHVEDDALVIGAPHPPEIGFLERLPAEAVHTMIALLQHGGLSVEEHARVFQTSPTQSRLHLAALADRRIVFERDGGRYELNRLLHQAVVGRRGGGN